MSHKNEDHFNINKAIEQVRQGIVIHIPRIPEETIARYKRKLSCPSPPISPIKIRKVGKNEAGYIYGLVSEDSDVEEINKPDSPLCISLSDESDNEIIIEKAIPCITLDHFNEEPEDLPAKDAGKRTTVVLESSPTVISVCNSPIATASRSIEDDNQQNDADMDITDSSTQSFTTCSSSLLSNEKSSPNVITRNVPTLTEAIVKASDSGNNISTNTLNLDQNEERNVSVLASSSQLVSEDRIDRAISTSLEPSSSKNQEHSNVPEANLGCNEVVVPTSPTSSITQGEGNRETIEEVLAQASNDSETNAVRGSPVRPIATPTRSQNTLNVSKTTSIRNLPTAPANNSETDIPDSVKNLYNSISVITLSPPKLPDILTKESSKPNSSAVEKSLLRSQLLDVQGVEMEMDDEDQENWNVLKANPICNEVVVPTSPTSSVTQDEENGERIEEISAQISTHSETDPVRKSSVRPIAVPPQSQNTINASKIISIQNRLTAPTNNSEADIPDSVKNFNNSISVIKLDSSKLPGIITKESSKPNTPTVKDPLLRSRLFDSHAFEMVSERNNIADSSPAESLQKIRSNVVTESFQLPNDTDVSLVSDKTSSRFDSCGNEEIRSTSIDGNSISVPSLPSDTRVDSNFNSNNLNETMPSYSSDIAEPARNTVTAEFGYLSNINYSSSMPPKIRVKSLEKLVGNYNNVESLLKPEIVSQNYPPVVPNEFTEPASKSKCDTGMNSSLKEVLNVPRNFNVSQNIIDMAIVLKKLRSLYTQFDTALRQAEKELRKSTVRDQRYEEYESIKKDRVASMAPWVKTLTQSMEGCLIYITSHQLLHELYKNFKSLKSSTKGSKYPNLRVMRDLLEELLYDGNWPSGNLPQKLPLEEFRDIFAKISRGEVPSGAISSSSKVPAPSSHLDDTVSRSGGDDSRPNSTGSDVIPTPAIPATLQQNANTPPPIPSIPMARPQNTKDTCKCSECYKHTLANLHRKFVSESNVTPRYHAQQRTGPPSMSSDLHHNTSQQSQNAPQSTLRQLVEKTFRHPPPPSYQQATMPSEEFAAGLANREPANFNASAYNETVNRNSSEAQLRQYRPAPTRRQFRVAYGQVNQNVTSLPTMQRIYDDNDIPIPPRRSLNALYQGLQSTSVRPSSQQQMPYQGTSLASSHHYRSNPVTGNYPATDFVNSMLYANNPQTTRYMNTTQYNSYVPSSHRATTVGQYGVATEQYRSQNSLNMSEVPNQNHINFNNTWRPKPTMPANTACNQFTNLLNDGIHESASDSSTVTNSDKPLSVQVVHSTLSPSLGPSPINSLENTISNDQPISVPLVQSSSSSFEQLCNFGDNVVPNGPDKDPMHDVLKEYLNIDSLDGPSFPSDFFEMHPI